MWADRYETICRNHRDVVAVYESRRGRFALLLRQTLVPLAEERPEWTVATRRTARAVVQDLRAAGWPGSAIVLQWLAPRNVAAIMERWLLRYDGDPERRARLAALAARHAADERFLAARERRRRRTPATPDEALALLALVGDWRQALKHWYCGMAPSWLAVQPATRRALMLQTHRWIAERALDPHADAARLRADLASDGPLARALERLVPWREQLRWRSWIRLVLADLRRALVRPREDRTEAWARWLFLIPYSIPVRTAEPPRQAWPEPPAAPASDAQGARRLSAPGARRAR